MRSLKFVSAFVLLVILVGVLVGCVPKPPEGVTVSEYCSMNDDFPTWFESHGDCVSTLELYWKDNPGDADIVGACKAFDNLGYANQGECIQALRGGIVE